MMTNEKNQTIAYYDDPANAYADQTVHADMSAIYARFEKYLAPGAAVLDAGCGSGRDSLHFMKAGYAVTAIDASQEMCDFASRLLQQEVRQLQQEGRLAGTAAQAIGYKEMLDYLAGRVPLEQAVIMTAPRSIRTARMVDRIRFFMVTFLPLFCCLQYMGITL